MKANSQYAQTDQPGWAARLAAPENRGARQFCSGRNADCRLVSFDVWIAIGGLLAGIVVGLTGMGGAAIVTPMLIFIFGVPPAVAVSTDVVSAASMKPVGAAVHLQRRTPHMRIVLWLCVGSIPGVVLGSLVFAQISGISNGGEILKHFVGFVLLLSVAVSVLRLRLRRFRSTDPNGSVSLTTKRKVLVVAAGLFVGLLVGITSVGSGTLIAATLVLLFPAMYPRRLVGTDLVQAVPMLVVGALIHWGVGDIDLAVLIPLLVGQLPGVWIGARISSRYDGQALRILLLVLIGASGLALIGLPAMWVGIVVATASVVIGVPILRQAMADRKSEADDEVGDSDENGAQEASVEIAAADAEASSTEPDPR